ncbi:nuclear transport factor 2 family protein [Mucilaginibacter auburnensis]|uniref:Putative SnoaL-like aldol condensation-catalyzing enzyme n=1 Tax=Mucilaginibacter auburnensis TaxID=1457233 RepID=A0A2H9VTS6_9SPHI|nr:ester cyclase [Mucilaginibacter auburnensis]PJJ84218.1 putative SnoaL-like aldol condensation-catalyzing enzyme [Mucilaginibacter auburnensis]
MEPTSDKTIITGFYREIVRERRSELIPQYVQENYVQHSPMGKDGRQGLVQMVEFLKKLPPVPENEPTPIVHLIGQDDLVAAHLDIHFMGKHIKVIELFRVEDGKAAEHWEVTEELTDATQPFIKLALNSRVSSPLDFLEGVYKQQDIVIHRIIKEGELMAIHAQAKDGANSIALFDIYQFKADKLIGHWHVKQPVPEMMPHSNGMF